jgi:hypothetical protein
MKVSSQRFRRAFFVSATAVATAAMTAAVVTASAAGAQPKPHAGPGQIGPGYPPPGGIYSLFTNCPLLNSLMAESPNITDPMYQGVSYAACVAGVAATGTLKVGNIVTPVVRPVNVQFGFVPPPNSAPGGDNTSTNLSPPPAVVPPPAGLSAMLVTKPDLIPESLTTALGCSTTTNPTVQALCTKAENFGGKYQDIYGLAQSAGQLTNFGLTSWTQRMKIQLINPLLGNNCYIGTDQNPIVINPQISLSSGGQLIVKVDPNPAKHPDTEVLDITAATASDTTFFAPAVTGCGFGGGLASVPVDEAIDTSAGLPSASGNNSLALNGTFQVALSAVGEDSSLHQPQNNAKALLSAFADSVGVPPASRQQAAARRITFAEARHIFGLK